MGELSAAKCRRAPRASGLSRRVRATGGKGVEGGRVLPRARSARTTKASKDKKIIVRAKRARGTRDSTNPGAAFSHGLQ